MLSNKGIVVIAAIAVSGGAALIAFSRQKKLHLSLCSKDSSVSSDSRSSSKILTQRRDKLQKKKNSEYRRLKDIPKFEFLEPDTNPDSFKAEKNQEKRVAKKVRFADDVVEPRGDGKEYRRRHEENIRAHVQMRALSDSITEENEGVQRTNCCNLPANRRVLYSSMMQWHSQYRSLRYY